jgi:dihydropyrimidinase
LPLERIAALAATNPARIMGLGHLKGSISPGLDADLALVDLGAEWTLRHALVRGHAVLRDDALVDNAVGRGRYVRRRLPS